MPKETFRQKSERLMAQMEADIKSQNTKNMVRLIFADAKAKTDARNKMINDMNANKGDNMLEDDTPQWEHTVWILAKVRCRTTHIDIDRAGNEALDDPSEWHVLEFDKGVKHSQEIVRVR